MRWLGILPREQLAQVYAAADVFVMPSRSETFGLVMLEAMACGTPVAAYPVDGPLEVLGQHEGRARGACWTRICSRPGIAPRRVPRHAARQRALMFSWAQASRQFLSPSGAGPSVRSGRRDPVNTKLSHILSSKL